MSGSSASSASLPGPVLVVGAGPTGLTAAFELARLGLPVRLVDKASGPATTSRAIGVQARTLELLDQRGLAAEMMRLGKLCRAACLYGEGRRLARLDFGRVESRYRGVLFLAQSETERLLCEALARLDVTPQWGVELVALAQGDPATSGPLPVRAQLRHADGRIEEYAAPWLIAAEGAHGIVRPTVGLPFEGRALPERYALGDLHLDGDLSEDDFHVFSSTDGFMVLFPMGGRRFRVVTSHSDAAHGADAPDLETLQQICDRRVHVPVRLRDMVWSSWFHINSRMVPRLRAGRLLLGGDAAHIHSPAGAQGMNTGIQDMINLCWKLALVSRGAAPDSLLDSYERERLPVMRQVLQRTDAMTRLVGSEDARVRFLFARLVPPIAATERVQREGVAQMSQVALHYRGSPLSAERPHRGALRAGDRVPDPVVLTRRGAAWVEVGLHTLLDPSRFVLLVSGGEQRTPLDRALVRQCDQDSDMLRLVEIASPEGGDAAAAFEALFGPRTCITLVRPDGYAALVAGEHSAARLLAHWRKRWLVPNSSAA